MSSQTNRRRLQKQTNVKNELTIVHIFYYINGKSKQNINFRYNKLVISTKSIFKYDEFQFNLHKKYTKIESVFTA